MNCENNCRLFSKSAMAGGFSNGNFYGIKN